MYDIHNPAFLLARKQAREETEYRRRLARCEGPPDLDEDPLPARIGDVVRGVMCPCVDAPADRGGWRGVTGGRERAGERAGGGKVVAVRMRDEGVGGREGWCAAGGETVVGAEEPG